MLSAEIEHLVNTRQGLWGEHTVDHHPVPQFTLAAGIRADVIEDGLGDSKGCIDDATPMLGVDRVEADNQPVDNREESLMLREQKPVGQQREVAKA